MHELGVASAEISVHRRRLGGEKRFCDRHQSRPPDRLHPLLDGPHRPEARHQPFILDIMTVYRYIIEEDGILYRLRYERLVESTEMDNMELGGGYQ